MAGYRPIGLSSAASSTIIAGRATSYADRRRAAADRLSTTADIARRLDAAVDVSPAAATSAAPAVPVDPDGSLRNAIRALVPLACRTPGFDVTVSLGPEHRWAARIQHSPEGVSAELVPGHGSPPGPHETTASETEIAAELAAWLWNGR